jgi:hypothetical protein
MNVPTEVETQQTSNQVLEHLATEVATILTSRLTPKDIVKISQLVFLEVCEAAHLLRVKPKTISTWISQDKIPVRYAGGRPIFLLSELLQWTLPENDKHSRHRLPSWANSNIVEDRLTANRERRNPDGSL